MVAEAVSAVKVEEDLRQYKSNATFVFDARHSRAEEW
jgi:hypothetical protein